MPATWKLYLSLLLSVIMDDAIAQLMTNNGVTFTIQAGVQLTVKGDVLNNSGTAIDNEGVIDLTGDWINNSGSTLFGMSNGTVIMNGVNQNIGGSNATTFNNLNLFNGIKTLMTDAVTGGTTLMGMLNCNDAILDLNSHTLTVRNPNPLGITRTTGYILSEDADNSSRVWWEIVGSGIHSIPFGNISGEDVSFAFECMPPPGAAASSLRVSTYPTLPGNTPYPYSPVLVTHVRDVNGIDNSMNLVDRFWHIEKTGAADYYFTYAPSENAAGGNFNMRAQQWNPVSDAWEMPLPGQTNPSGQQVFVPGITSATPYVMTGATWTLSLESNPLPVELLFFSAHVNMNAEVVCEWRTASEVNNDYFVVMKSKDGVNFEKVGTVDGAGNSSSVLNYSFKDANPYAGTSYYRLKQVDFDGAFSYAQDVAVRLEGKENLLTLFPNPAKDNLYLHLKGGGNGYYALKDISGKILKQENLEDAPMQQIFVGDVSGGCYLLEVVTGEIRITEKIVVVK